MNDCLFFVFSGNGDNVEKECFKVIEEVYRLLFIIMMLFGLYFGYILFDNLYEII